MLLSKYRFKRLFREAYAKLRKLGPGAYWSNHLVAHDDWTDSKTVLDSINQFHWRNAQYPGYIDLMPVDKADGLVVVDYGCGPGNDLIGFSEFSKPKKLIGVDVSKTALSVAETRVALHDKPVEFVQIEEEKNSLPFKSNSIDLIHSSGVLHHVKNLDMALVEIRRTLKLGGKLNVMVYNYDSIWLHLYTAFIVQIEQGKYKDLSISEAFRHVTDGENCPISHCYRPSEFIEKVENHGFSGKFKGASMSLHELELLPKRFAAIKNRNLAKEHSDFLIGLEFNKFGYPTINGNVAGINACFEFTKKEV